MEQEIKIPEIGESITGGIISEWLKQNGEQVTEGEELFELETDKATLAVPSTASGVLKRLAEEGQEVEVGEVVAAVASAESSTESSTIAADTSSKAAKSSAASELSPAVRRIVEEQALDPATITGTGKDGRITKGDALKAAEASEKTSQSGTRETDGGRAIESETIASKAKEGSGMKTATSDVASTQPAETRVKMSPLRKKIASNLVQSKQTSAHLTTFNEADMSAVMALRAKYRDDFEKKHEVRLGFMSFFVKAACAALEQYPQANSRIEGEEMVFINRYNIGVAVSTDRGLIVPVIRDADQKSFALIEQEILSFATRAKNNKIRLDEITGGSFTITNGGVFGSLLSTPIPAPPQSAILGMHTIQKRPVVVDDQIVVKPMMYLAVTYDHRIMDGREAVSFLVKIKQLVEDPHQLLLDL